MKKPRDCPRCGTKAELKQRDDDIWYGCTECITFGAPFNNKEEALQYWNDADEEYLYGPSLSMLEKRRK